MTVVLTLREPIAEHVRDGDAVALQGSTHLIPFATREPEALRVLKAASGSAP